MKKVLSGVILVSFLFIMGCSTVVTGTSNNLNISSNTPGAKVKIDGMDYGMAPVNIDLDSNKTHTIQIIAPGYEPKTMIVKRQVSGWVWGNIFLGGLIGLSVDLVTGGIYVLETDHVNADLTKVDQLAKVESL